MIVRKKFSDFSGHDEHDMKCLRWIYLKDDEPLAQLEIHPDEGPFDCGKNRCVGKYTIFWLTKPVSVANLCRYEEKIINGYYCPSGQCLKNEMSLPDPIRISAHYYYTDDQDNGHEKHLFRFLPLSMEDRLDIYDQEMQRINDKFVVENESRMSYARHDVEGHFGLGNFSVCVHPNIRHNDHAEIEFLMTIPYVPKEFFIRTFLETCDKPISFEEAEAIINLAKEDIRSFQNH